MNELKTIHGILLEMLVEIDQICKKYDIPYFLSGGTLLGALRHEGFIPWDDDVDINMTREAYEKFEAVIDFEKRPDRELVSHNRFKGYTSPIPRYTKLDSTNIVRGRVADECPHGLFIDIIILDPMPKSPDEILAWKNKHYVYCELMEYPYVIASRRCDWDAVDTEMYHRAKKESNERGRETVIRELSDELFSIPESESDYYCMRFGTLWLGIMPIEWFKGHREVEFENRKFPVPAEAEKEMCLFYGLDWKYIHPKESVHVFFTLPFLDSGNCEREYFKVFKRESFRSVIETYNDKCVDYHVELHNRLPKTIMPYVRMINHKIAGKIGVHGEKYYRDNPEEGYELFSEYIDFQISSEFISNDIVIDLSEEHLELMMEVLLSSDRIGKAKIISDMHVGKHDDNPRIKELIERIYLLYRIAVAIDVKNLSDIKKMLPECDRDDRNVPTIICADLICRNEDAVTDETIGYARRMIEENPDNGEIIKYAADILKKAGVEEADDYYSIAVEHTENGIHLIEMKNNGVKEADLKLKSFQEITIAL